MPREGDGSSGRAGQPRERAGEEGAQRGGTQRSWGEGQGRSPREIDRLREASGISLDAEGRFLHRGEPITHARTLEILRRSFRREPDGRYSVSIGRERAYVSIEAAPYAVQAVVPAPAGGAPRLRLSDGSEESLDPSTLILGSDGVLRCAVKGDHLGRFTRAGQIAMGALLEEDPPGSGAFALFVNGRRWHVRHPG